MRKMLMVVGVLGLVAGVASAAWIVTGSWNNALGVVTRQSCTEAEWYAGNGEWSTHVYADPTRDAVCPWPRSLGNCTRAFWQSGGGDCASVRDAGVSEHIVCWLTASYGVTIWEAWMARGVDGTLSGPLNSVSIYRQNALPGRNCSRTWGGVRFRWYLAG